MKNATEKLPMKKTRRNSCQRNTGRRLTNILWIPLALCLLAIGPRTAMAQIATLVLTGEAAPDGNGTFSEFSVPTLNANGKVAFGAGFTGTASPSTDARGIYIADINSVTQLVRAGETVPDGNGVFKFFTYDFSTIERVALNDSGEVAFTANLTGTSGGTSDNIGLFGASAVGGVKEFVRLSDPAPDGNGIFASPDPIGYAFSHPGLDSLGRASFDATFTGTSGGLYVDDSGAFRSNGTTVTRLMRAGQVVPGTSDIIESIIPWITSNPGGQVAKSVGLYFDFMGSPPPDDLQRIYAANGTTLEEVVRSGITIADGNGTLTSFLDFIIADNGDVAFKGYVGDSDNWLDDGERLFLTDGGSPVQIAGQGKLGPGEAEFKFEYFFGIDVNNQSKVAFAASLHRNVAPPDNRTSGIYLGNAVGITKLVGQGDPAPDGNGTFGDVAVPLQMNNSGEIVFSASLEGTASPGFDSHGIFFIDADSTVHQVARAGQPLEGTTITSMAFLGSEFIEASDLKLAGMNGINDAGQVAFMAWLADGRSGVFLWGSGSSGGIFADGFEGGDPSSWSGTTP